MTCFAIISCGSTALNFEREISFDKINDDTSYKLILC